MYVMNSVAYGVLSVGKCDTIVPAACRPMSNPSRLARTRAHFLPLSTRGRLVTWAFFYHPCMTSKR